MSVQCFIYLLTKYLTKLMTHPAHQLPHILDGKKLKISFAPMAAVLFLSIHKNMHFSAVNTRDCTLYHVWNYWGVNLCIMNCWTSEPGKATFMCVKWCSVRAQGDQGVLCSGLLGGYIGWAFTGMNSHQVWVRYPVCTSVLQMPNGTRGWGKKKMKKKI